MAKAITRFRQMPHHKYVDNPFNATSTIAQPASDAQVAAAWSGVSVPQDVAALWLECKSARLFEDTDYGQWGLVLLSPLASARRTAEERRSRPEDMREGDVVIGEFLGDQDLLVVAPSQGTECRVLVALPLDPRAEWYAVATDLESFLERYFDAGGEKFWERRHP